MTAIRLELRRARTLTAWLAIGLIAYGAIVTVMYPLMAESDELLQQYMTMFPEDLLVAVGLTGSLANPGVFFTTYTGAWLWPVMAAVAALLLGTRVAGDLDRGFLDLPLATPLSRAQYLVAGIVVQALALAVLALAAVGGMWAVGVAVSGPFDAGRFALAGVLCWAFGCAIAGVTTLLAVATLSRGRASGIVAGILIVMYLVFIVVQVDPDLSWLAPLSAWDHFRTTEVIDEGAVPVGEMLLFTTVAVAGWVGAVATFRNRDLAA